MADENAFKKYRDELNAFTSSPRSRMIINADEEWQSKNRQDSAGMAGFKLQNGEVVKEFVTIWELFDHREEFHKCIEMLAGKAEEIYGRLRFTKIISASPTARELAEYLFDALKRKLPEQELSVTHLGNYQRAALPHGPSLNFKDEYVLLLADVVNRGYLIDTMAEIVEKGGGRVAAVLAVLLTNEQWIARQRGSRPVLRQFARSNARLYNLTDYAIRSLRPGEYDESKVIPIDYNNVLPERRNFVSTHYAPAFHVRTMFKHLEAAEAVDFGFYELNDARLTSAFILPRLLEDYEQDIWRHIRPQVIEAAKRSREVADGTGQSGELLLVTTYNRKDLLFKDYIQDRLAEEGYQTTTAITLKRGVTDTPYLNLTLGVGGTDVRGKEVVLVLATLSSQEKLRNIVSLLVDGQVKKIIVLCLLNRMGPFTTNFIRVIERFTKRVTIDGPATGDAALTVAAVAAGDGAQVIVAGLTQRPATFTDFSFSMVYSLLDLRDDDISSIGSELEWLFSDFRTKTKVPSFVRLCDRIEGYFHSKPFIERAYAQTPYKPLDRPYRLMVEDENGAQPIEVTTQEAKIALMTYNLALNRDFSPVLEELISTLDRRTFIHLYGLLLSDIHHLRFAGTLRTLKESILARLDALRLERFSIDIGAGGEEKLRELINAEVYLLFGLGIIAHYDSGENLKGLAEAVVDLLFCEKTPEEWLKLHPLSLQEYFTEERIFFVIAFLLRGLFPQFNRGEVAVDVKRQLNEAAVSFKKIFKQKFGALAKSEKSLKARASLIMNNLDLILTETGSHDNLEKHQIVRYLHREVLRPKEGHNPIFTTLSSLISMMNERAEGRETSHDFEVDEVQFLTRVDEALSGTSSLHMIALEVRQLFFFTPTVQDQQERYTSPVGQLGFSNDVDELVRRLGDIRQRRSSFSRADLDRVRELYTELRTDFFDPASHLRKVLGNYVVCLDEVVENVLHEVNLQLNKEGFSDLLLPVYNNLRARRSAGRCVWPVLQVRQRLRETFRNLFTNLRHAFTQEERGSLPADAVELDFEQTRYTPYPERQEKSGVALKLHVKGRAAEREVYERLENTVGDQLLFIRELGGDWNLEAEDGSHYTFTVKMLTRFGYLPRGEGSVDDEQIKREDQLDDEL